MGMGMDDNLTINEKAIVAPTVPAPTMATFAVLGLGILFWYGFGFGALEVEWVSRSDLIECRASILNLSRIVDFSFV